MAASKLRRGLATALGLVLIGATPACSQTPGVQTGGVSPVQKLHDALRLTPAQEAGWQTYRAQANAPNRTQERRRSAAALFPTIGAPQRMDLMEAEMRQEMADLHQQALALKAFYATLTPEQQKLFDTQTLPPAKEGNGPGNGPS